MTEPILAMGCAGVCMDCGGEVPDLGPFKTPYRCDDCKRPLFEGNRTLWCVVCHHAHDVTPVGTPPERCRACLGGGDWWTRNAPFVVTKVDPEARTVEMKRIPCVICGAKPGEDCDRERHASVERGLAQMEGFAKVGSTDICMRRGCLESRMQGGDACVCKPDEKAFFQHLPDPGPEIRVPVELSQWYRTLLLTGILPSEDMAVVCPKCGEPHCTKNHAEFM